MKKCIVLLLLLMTVLCGCAARQDAPALEQALDRLKKCENYTITETIRWDDVEKVRIAQYDRDVSCISDDGEQSYFCREDETCWGYVYIEDYEKWAKKEIAYSDIYFYDQQFLGRLNKISGYLNMGLLRFDEEKQCYIGENITSSYVYDGEEHRPLSLEVFLENGEITVLRETWIGQTEDDQPCEKTAEIRVSAQSETQVQLPEEAVSYEDLKNAAKYSQK